MKNFSITFALGAVVLFASNVAAHGRFLSPPTRIAEGDENQGFTKTRSPTTEEPCAGVPFQGVKSQFSPGQTIPISWEIGAAHRGPCFLQLSKDDGATFQTIKEVPDCANSNGIFNSEATLPSDVTCEKCVMRWRWEAELTKELYLNCADISIGGSGAPDGGATGGGAAEGGATEGGATEGGATDGGTQSPAGEPQPQPAEQPPPPGEPQPPQPEDNPPTVEIPSEEPSTAEPSTAEPSTAEPSTAEPSTAEPSTAEPSTGEKSPEEPSTAPSTEEPSPEEPSTAPSTAPSTGDDPDCDKPATDGGEQPQEPQPPKSAKRYRRSTLRARPRRLRRSA